MLLRNLFAEVTEIANLHLSVSIIDFSGVRDASLDVDVDSVTSREAELNRSQKLVLMN